MIKEQWYGRAVVTVLIYADCELHRLCNVRFTTVKANIDLKGVTINAHGGDFSATSLAHVINTETLNKLIVQTWLDRAGQSSL
jgi:hypothetical protein